MGKPVGFKLCVGRKNEFINICKAMVETGIEPDFITMDGGEGGSEVAPVEFSGYHHSTIHSFMELVAAAGFSHPKEITLAHINRRVSMKCPVTYYLMNTF